MELPADPATGALGGAPYGATKRVRGVAKWGGLHAGAATGAFGGAPHGATIPVRGVPTWLSGIPSASTRCHQSQAGTWLSGAEGR